MSDTSVASQTGCVVVFYRPDQECVKRANRLSRLYSVIVIDNTEKTVTAESLGLTPAIHYVPNGSNLGIATALNQGIEQLLAQGMTCALLFDQDSEPSDTLLKGLPALMARTGSDRRVALIGPAYDDARLGGVAPFVRFRYFKLERVAPVGDRLIDVDFLITSGSCINLGCWHEVGPMDDSLFIDFVDLEWCVRARNKGFRILGVPWLTLSHQLGGPPVKVLGRNYPMHSAVRHYYLFRNAIALMLRPDMPLTWKTTELVKLPGRLLIYALLPASGGSHLKMAIKGIYHALTRRMGRL
ncbi:rhamnosyltransferase [Paraburkholderia diazotrophica]|uniref:Rhamnosyltransferase n=1 Tax=Paraburkholderia diazotrophica TaxID=667676 RepID=A0A1H7DS35_9BURK|nr:glycosyltransferase family 2 protein [Paraburkholderia diazotrophica]SEK02110.1 rhamnosyltransferase [Paraburkholderia diazotrophica]